MAPFDSNSESTPARRGALLSVTNSHRNLADHFASIPRYPLGYAPPTPRALPDDEATS